MAFLCPTRVRKGRRKKENEEAPPPGRITGSDSIDTLVRVGLEKDSAPPIKQWLIVTSDFWPCVNNELRVLKGQVVQLLYQENDWVYVISEDRQEGFVPYSFCEVLDTGEVIQRSQEIFISYKQGGEETVTNQRVKYQELQTSKINTVNINRDNISSTDGIVYKPPNRDTQVPNKDLKSAAQVENLKLLKKKDDEKLLTSGCANNANKCCGNGPVDNTDILVIYDDDEKTIAPKINVNKNAISQPTSHITSKAVSASSVLSNVDMHTEFSKCNIGLNKVLYPYEAREEDDVTVHQGELVKLLNKDDPDWFWVQTASSLQGFVPSSYLVSNNDISAVGLNTKDKRERQNDSLTPRRYLPNSCPKGTSNRNYETTGSISRRESPTQQEHIATFYQLSFETTEKNVLKHQPTRHSTGRPQLAAPTGSHSEAHSTHHSNRSQQQPQNSKNKIWRQTEKHIDKSQRKMKGSKRSTNSMAAKGSLGKL